jgi:cobalamin biosynthetic protein CobC
MDFTPEHSVIELAPSEGLVVLRSFGKAYGLPGLRLGFALCPAQLAARLRLALGPWSVNGPAIAVGAIALTDAAWLSQSAELLAASARRLDKLLIGAGFDIVGGTSLFRLAATSRTGSWFKLLGENGIFTRRFEERPMWLRFGLPGSEAAWERLTRALERR